VSIKTDRVITTVEMMVITPWGAWAEIYYIDKLMLPHGTLAEVVVSTGLKPQRHRFDSCRFHKNKKFIEIKNIGGVAKW